ncbi:MAG: response regulator transcription factor, partial [Ignavibacteriae bacterium]|nr:response regulator transcription factor [Ignavibacteriota bacterium]
MKILIVEDNMSMYENIAKTVNTAGNEVSFCSTSSEVLQAYERWHPDVVIMDIRIKPLNGIKTTKMLRELYPNVKIIMLTSYDEPEYRNAAREAGANGYVLKDNPPHLQ